MVVQVHQSVRLGLGFTYWLVALVATLVSQGLFPTVHEPAVPCLEIATVMRCEGLLDVSYNKVIELDVANPVRKGTIQR